MALEGELNGLEGCQCECGTNLYLKVCHSNAGYYLGYECPGCGPYSRETGYFRTYEQAERELKKQPHEISTRGTAYQPGPLILTELE